MSIEQLFSQCVFECLCFTVCKPPAASRPRHARRRQLSLRLRRQLSLGVRVDRQARGAGACADAAAACRSEGWQGGLGWRMEGQVKSSGSAGHMCTSWGSLPAAERTCAGVGLLSSVCRRALRSAPSSSRALLQALVGFAGGRCRLLLGFLRGEQISRHDAGGPAEAGQVEGWDRATALRQEAVPGGLLPAAAGRACRLQAPAAAAAPPRPGCAAPRLQPPPRALGGLQPCEPSGRAGGAAGRRQQAAAAGGRRQAAGGGGGRQKKGWHHRAVPWQPAPLQLPRGRARLSSADAGAACLPSCSAIAAAPLRAAAPANAALGLMRRLGEAAARAALKAAASALAVTAGARRSSCLSCLLCYHLAPLQ